LVLKFGISILGKLGTSACACTPRLPKLHHTLSNIYFSRGHFHVAYPSFLGRSVPELTSLLSLEATALNIVTLHALRPLLPSLSTFSVQYRNLLHFPVLGQVPFFE
jgi:hypothetical protein